MAQSHVNKFPLLCCCLLTLIFIASHVNSTGGDGKHASGSASGAEQPSASPSAQQQNRMTQQQQQQQPEPSASLPPWKFGLNGCQPDTGPSFPNIYPLSKSQLTAELDQKIMAERITFNDGQFHPELEKIIEGLDAHLYRQYISKSWKKLLRDWMNEAIINTEADNTDLLFEILVTTTNEQKHEMDLYNSDICDRMLKHPVLNMTENRGYKTLMRQLCKEKRDESFDYGCSSVLYKITNPIDNYLKKEGERTWYSSINPINRISEKNIAELLAQTNYSRLRCVFDQSYFSPAVRVQLEKMMMIEENREKKILQAIYTIHMDLKQGRPELLFHLFDRNFGKLEKDNDLDAFLRNTGRLLITHAQVDLADIGTNNLNKLKDWLTSAMTLNLDGKETRVERKRQLAAFIQIVDLVEDENWKKHLFKKND